MKSIIDFILKLVYTPKPASGGPPKVVALAESLTADIKTLGTGGNDGLIKKGILQKAKQIAAQIGGVEMVIPQYAVAVSLGLLTWFGMV